MFGWRGSIAIAGSFCGPGAFETSTFGGVAAQLAGSETVRATSASARLEMAGG